MSEKMSLNKKDAMKVLKGLGIAAGGAALTYLLDLLPTLDFGPYTPIVVAVSSTFINLCLKYFQRTK